MKRPFGITLIAILALLSGLFGLCLPALTLAGSTLFGPLAAVGVVASILLIIGPVLHFIFAYGAFKLRSWAWYLGLIASGLTLVGVIIDIINGASFWSAIFGGLLPIIIFIYLLTPNARKAFRKAPQQPAAITPPTQTPAPAQVEPPATAQTPTAVTPTAQTPAPMPVEPPAAAETPAADNTTKS
jgi:hypothetical protein